MNDDAFLYREEHGEIEEIYSYLANIPTSALVAELEQREGVSEITLNRNDSCSSRCCGPGKILWVPDNEVVRGE